MRMLCALVLCLAVYIVSGCPPGVCNYSDTCCNVNPSAGLYGCCPSPNAVCCPGGLTCCPRGTVCNMATRRCHYRSAISEGQEQLLSVIKPVAL